MKKRGKKKSKKPIKKAGLLAKLKGFKMPHHGTLIFSGVFVLLNLAFLLYPSNRAMPFASIAGLDIGGMTKEQVAKSFQEKIDDQSVVISINNKKKEIPFKQFGIIYDVDMAAEAAMSHRDKWYFPVGSFLERNTASNEIKYGIDDLSMQLAITDIKEFYDDPFINADLKIVDGILEVTKSQTGYGIVDTELREQIFQRVNFSGSDIYLTTSEVKPFRSESHIAEAKGKLELLLNTPFSLGANGSVFTPTSAEKSQWATIVRDKNDPFLSLEANSPEIQSYIAGIASQVNEPTTSSVVTIVDGTEVSRTDGASGNVVERPASLELISRLIQDPRSDSSTVQLPTVLDQPELVYERSYSTTSSGLQTLLNDWVAAQGVNTGVVIKELGGQGRAASYQANTPFVTASTYKMFLAFVVLREIDNGVFTLSDSSGLAGWSVKACIDEMILRSTNPCAIALGEKVGWAYADSVIQGAGFSSTSLNNYNSAGALISNKLSTAADEGWFIERLNAGGLISPGSTSYLLGLLQSQIFRWGIPLGVPGIAVADKVGFWSGYKHDCAVVYAPNGQYILCIMTLGGNDPSFANLSAQVYNFFN